MNSRIIITAGLGVPLSTGPSTILFNVWFYFILLRNDIIVNVLTKYSHVCNHTVHVYVLLCVLK